MTFARSSIAFLAFLLLAACGGGDGGAPAAVAAPASPPVAAPPPAPPPPPPPRPASVEREIAPGLTDAAINIALSAHFAVNPTPAATPANRLFVMLPGTGAIPRFYREIVRTGAARGYHGIGLTYPNDEAVGDRCSGNADLDCAGRVRREVITGDDSSPLIAIDRANSIAGRLTALLRYLDASFPTEGWGQFLVGGAPDWARITIAGHSQGGGHTAYFAKLFVLDRTIMFSSPGDLGQVPGTLARWLTLPNVTPVDRQFGFTHVADELVPYALITAVWRTIGIDAFGGPVSVDTATPPYLGSHQLSTAAPPNPSPIGPVAGPNHASPVVDVASPLTASGDFLYRPVWIALAFP